RAFAIAERDRAGVLDLFERSGERPDIRRLLGVGGGDEDEDGRRGDNSPRPAQDAARAGGVSPGVLRPPDPHQAALGARAASSSPRSPRSPPHFAIGAVARVLQITLVAERPISRN